MLRRRYLKSMAMPPIVLGVAGCVGEDEADDDVIGRGTITIENRSEGSVRANYGMLDPEEPIEEAAMERVELGIEGDSFEAIYTDVTGGPYRFVVSVPGREGSPVEQQWDLEECQEFGVTARIFTDALNMSGTRCVRSE